MAYLDDTLQFDKDLLNALKDAQLEMARSGGAEKVKVGDKFFQYRDLAPEIKRLETSIYIAENGCPERNLCQ